jgi:hypothetical protein
MVYMGIRTSRIEEEYIGGCIWMRTSRIEVACIGGEYMWILILTA